MKEFENKINKYFLNKYNCKDAFLTQTGTYSFDVLFKNENFKENDEIMVPVTLCDSVIQVIADNNLIPVFVDVNKYFQINKRDLKNKITKNTKAIIFVHQYGIIGKFNKKYYNYSGEKIITIEDCAQCFPSKSIFKKSDYAIFSFGKKKPLDVGGYGILISRNKNIEKKSKEFIGIEEEELLRKLTNYKFYLNKKFTFAKLYAKQLKGMGKAIKLNKKKNHFHRVLLKINFSEKEYERFEDKMYDFQEKENIDNFQSTIELAPFQLNKYSNLIKKTGERYNHGCKLSDFPIYKELIKKIVYLRTSDEVNENNIGKTTKKMMLYK